DQEGIPSFEVSSSTRKGPRVRRTNHPITKTHILQIFLHLASINYMQYAPFHGKEKSISFTFQYAACPTSYKISKGIPAYSTPRTTLRTLTSLEKDARLPPPSINRKAVTLRSRRSSNYGATIAALLYKCFPALHEILSVKDISTLPNSITLRDSDIENEDEVKTYKRYPPADIPAIPSDQHVRF
ncbi:hypothetical protein N7447_005010, partial [Penicillium robsamsonii]|uniref:uncharacterized protein n=1 Tax=Penicillium robsamsonii TaxID=1792511 RepID=UPI002546BD25